MSKKVRIELDHEGFRQLLNSSEVASLVDSKGSELASRAGAGFIAKPSYGGFGGGRHICHVGTSDKASMEAQARDKALTKALHGMGA